MGFKEVASLDADVTVALGKKNKETGKPYPKQAEGYYLGTRSVESRKGESKLHFLQTEEGNLGVWGTTDLNRKLLQVPPGTMVRITSTGTKPTPNGDMYVYKVEVDGENTVDVSRLNAAPAAEESYEETEEESTDENQEAEEESEEDQEQSKAFAAKRAANAAKVQEILKRNKAK